MGSRLPVSSIAKERDRFFGLTPAFSTSLSIIGAKVSAGKQTAPDRPPPKAPAQFGFADGCSLFGNTALEGNEAFTWSAGI